MHFEIEVLAEIDKEDGSAEVTGPFDEEGEIADIDGISFDSLGTLYRKPWRHVGGFLKVEV